MHSLYVFSVWIHILAATIWLGGMAFLSLVLVPWMRRSGANAELGAKLLSETGRRFRNVGWICFGLVLVTGTFNAYCRGVRWPLLLDRAWLESPFGSALALKVALFGAVLCVSLVHDLVIGPRAVAAMRTGAPPEQRARLRRAASLLGRANAFLALVIVALAVILVRGWP